LVLLHRIIEKVQIKYKRCARDVKRFIAHIYKVERWTWSWHTRRWLCAMTFAWDLTLFFSGDDA